MSSSTTTATSSSVNDSNDNITPPNPPTAHNQFIADPLAHFNAIPWCAAQLQDPANLNVSPSDRRPLPNGEASFVRKTMNSATTVRACVTYYRAVKPSPLPPPPSTSSSSTSTVTSMPASKTTTTTTTTTTATEKTKNNDNSNNDNNPPISASTALLSGGGKACGEDPRNPFLLFNALVDLGPDCTSYVGTMHGGLFGVLMDEVMGTAANLQSCMFPPPPPFFSYLYLHNPPPLPLFSSEQKEKQVPKKKK